VRAAALQSYRFMDAPIVTAPNTSDLTYVPEAISSCSRSML